LTFWRFTNRIIIIIIIIIMTCSAHETWKWYRLQTNTEQDA